MWVAKAFSLPYHESRNEYYRFTTMLKAIVDSKYDTWLYRFVASVIDGALFMLFIPLYFLITLIKNEIVLIPLVMLYYSSYYLYSVIMHYKYGQTIGKKIMKIQVVSEKDETNISFKQALMRDSFWIIFEIIGIATIIFGILEYAEFSSAATKLYDTFFSLISFIWIIIELITMLFNEKRRAVHDFLGSTVVIKLETDSK